MMKAILIIDLPMMCAECPMFTWASRDNYKDGFCTHSHKLVKFDLRPLDCPLKPMPEKKDVTVKRIEDIQSYSITEVADKISAKIILKTNEVFALGWNTCLDSIIGENNESNIGN